MKFSLHHPHTVWTFEAVSLFGTGLMAGATAYITAVEVPGRANKPAPYQLENYHELFPRAAHCMKNTGMVVTLLTMATSALTKKKAWLVSLVCLGALGPFTGRCIQPTNDTLMTAKDGNAVTKELKAWGKLHNVRTGMMLVAFAGAVVAILEG